MSRSRMRMRLTSAVRSVALALAREVSTPVTGLDALEADRERLVAAEPESFVPVVVPPPVGSEPRGLANVHLVLGVTRRESFGATRAAELGRRVEQQSRERAAVHREVVRVLQRPVRELVEHDAGRAVPAGERDRRAPGILAVEGLARALAGPQPRHVGEAVLGEARRPPEEPTTSSTNAAHWSRWGSRPPPTGVSAR